MLRGGVLVDPPEAVSESNMDIEYVGPLARSQRMEEAVAVERLYQLAMNVAQIDPAIMDIIDHEQAIRMRARLLGVPKTILRSEDDVAEMREAKAQQQQQMMEAQQQQQQADVMAKTGQAVEKMSSPQAQEMMGEAMDQAESLKIPT